MKFLDIGDRWNEAKDIARHLGREDEVVANKYDGVDCMLCLRKKVTDRRYNIILTDSGFIVLMDMEDINYHARPVAGEWYYCRMENAKIGELKSLFLVYIHESNDNFIKMDYQTLNDDYTPYQHGKGSLSIQLNVEFKTDQVRISEFRKAHRSRFFT